jgi:hypothetical protein
VTPGHRRLGEDAGRHSGRSREVQRGNQRCRKPGRRRRGLRGILHTDCL